MIDREIIEKLKTKPIGFTLWVVLFHLANIHTGVAEVTWKQLQNETGMTRKMVRYWLDQFLDWGWIKCEFSRITICDYYKYAKVPDEGPDEGLDEGPDENEATYDNNVQKQREKNSKGPDEVPDEVPDEGPDRSCSLLPKKKGSKREVKGKKGNSVNAEGTALALSSHNDLTPGSQVWNAYSAAYTHRYGATPVRNAKQNAHAKKIAERLGLENALATVVFYVHTSKSFYVSNCHALSLCEKDCEGLDVQRRKGQQMTDTLSRQIDNSSTIDQAFANVLKAHKEKENQNAH